MSDLFAEIELEDKGDVLRIRAANVQDLLREMHEARGIEDLARFLVRGERVYETDNGVRATLGRVPGTRAQDPPRTASFAPGPIEGEEVGSDYQEEAPEDSQGLLVSEILDAARGKNHPRTAEIVNGDNLASAALRKMVANRTGEEPADDLTKDQAKAILRGE